MEDNPIQKQDPQQAGGEQPDPVCEVAKQLASKGFSPEEVIDMLTKLGVDPDKLEHAKQAMASAEPSEEYGEKLFGMKFVKPQE